MSERPKVGIAAIIIKDGKVLLGQRKGAHGVGSWAFPGGHLEYGETWGECVARESMEEAGITVKNIRFGAVTNDIFEAEEKHYITIAMVADYDSGEVQLMEPNKCERWEWFEWNKLPQPLFVPIQNLVKQGYNPIS